MTGHDTFMYPKTGSLCEMHTPREFTCTSTPFEAYENNPASFTFPMFQGDQFVLLSVKPQRALAGDSHITCECLVRSLVPKYNSLSRHRVHQGMIIYITCSPAQFISNFRALKI